MPKKGKVLLVLDGSIPKENIVKKTTKKKSKLPSKTGRRKFL